MRKLRNSELNRLSEKEFKLNTNNDLVVVLDNVRSLHNVGSVFRTCDGLGITDIYLCGITAVPPNKEIHKTALGAENTVRWHYFNNTIDAIKKLKDEDFSVISIEQADGSIPLNKYSCSENVKEAIIFGHEVKGVSQEVVDNSDICIDIPMTGTKHSFNISVSVGIVLWELRRNRI